MPKGSFFEQVEKLKTSHRILIFAGTIILLVVVFGWFFYLPKTQEIEGTSKHISDLKTKLNRAMVRARAYKKFQAEYDAVDAQFKEALKLLPNEKEIPSLLKTITKLGTDSHLVFRLFSPQKEKPGTFYMKIPVSIEVSGPYHNVAVFFDKVGKMERIVNILNVSMKPVSKTSNILVTRCDAVTYRFKGASDVKIPHKKRRRR